jgi:hypothetical protein
MELHTKKKSHRDKEPTAREILRTEESKPRGRKLEISVQTSLEKKKIARGGVAPGNGRDGDT